MAAPAKARPGTSLALEGVRKRFGAVTAVDGVSLEVGEGEFVTLLGASGSGKTTTLMIVAGFHLPDAGRVLLGGADVTELPPYRRDLGLVYQNYALFPHMSVAKNVAFPLEMRRRPKDEIGRRVQAALELVHLGGFEGRLPHQLSGGQQQRVALARALVFEPPVLLMDEPLGALDKKLREAMQAEIKQLQRKLGITTVYVTHDQEEALTLSDRVVVMSAGRIEQVGTPADIYERPANRFVADFMGATNFLAARIADTGPPAAVTPSGARLRVKDGHGRPAGAEVLVVVRPERVRMAAPGVGAGGRLAARVEDVTYVGGILRYRLRLESGESLVAVEPNLGGAGFQAGQAVEAWWEPKDASVIEGEDNT
ncbi:MAG: ABC transporter ATP-binding protein [Candidatus Rokubacteria bacterium]|nr:ABC transporter ATP-binding protein [Candidatus Rokubacteria bacterium]